MAKNSMTFNASIRLNSAQFKKGIAEVKSAIAGLKSSFLSLAGALGAGLGFSQFISSMRDTAVQLSTAQNVLKNVSKVTKEFTDGVTQGTIEINNYAENMAYVRKLAHDYSQDLVGLTENFAKFHAACDKTNLSLEQQKDVFEALTRAAAYYHMSADQTNDMTLAITQMMSKGKVSSEELRRQLGNVLPGAFNLMAAAIGVSTAELEDMMKKGQVISSEVLPRFAAMLNTVTKNADFDSLQMSLNKLKNTWTEFVERSGAENIFQGVIDSSEKVLKAISNNLRLIGASIKGLIAAIVSTKIFSYLEKRGNQYFAGLETGIKQANKAYQKYAKDIEKIQEKISVDKTTGAVTPNRKMAALVSQRDIDNMIAYNQELARLQRTQNSLYGGKAGGRTFLLDEGDIAKLEAANKELLKARGTIETATKQSRTWISTIGGGIKSIFAQLKASLASLGITALVGILIGAVTAIYSYIKKIRDEWKRVNSIVDDYTKYIETSNNSVKESNAMLERNLKIMQDEAKSDIARVNALKEINKLMGTTYNKDALDKTKKAYQDITEEVYKWIEATKKQAKIQALASKAAEAEIEIEKINIRNSELKREREKLSKGLFTGFKLGKIEIEESINAKAIEQYNTIIEHANKELDSLQVKWLELVRADGPAGGGAGAESNIEKVLEKYTDSLKELDNKLKEHAITQEEYNEEFDNLVTKFWKEAAGTGKYSIDKILEKFERGDTLTKLENWYKELYENAREAAANNTARAAAKAIEDSIDEAIAAADKELDAEFDKWSERMDKITQANIDSLLTAKPSKKNRDKTFDYKKTKSTIQDEDFSISDNYVKELEEAINTIISKYDKLEDAAEAVRNKIAEWKGELNLAKKEAATLEQAMKLAKIQEDIDNLDKSIRNTVYGGIKNMASSMDRVVKGVESIKTTFEDSDSTGWEKFIVVFNELTQIIDTIISAYQTVQAVQEATNKMNEAEISLEATKIALLEKELLLRQALAAEKGLETKNTEKLAAANMAEAASANISSSAKAGDAIAGATASGAKLPFPYNIAAIAAGVAAVLAALAAMSKFANGGIVGGNSYSGDQQMARVNSGEMILNRKQQKNLFDIANGKGSGGGQVEFVIRGKDLVGTLNNYNRIKRG